MCFKAKNVEALLFSQEKSQIVQGDQPAGLGLRCDKVTPAQKVSGD
jgi:hypothetical protein